MAWSFSTVKRSIGVFAGGFFAFVLVWYFRSRQRKHKQVADSGQNVALNAPSGSTKCCSCSLYDAPGEISKVIVEEQDPKATFLSKESPQSISDSALPISSEKHDENHCSTEIGSHTPTSSFVSSLSSSEHDGDLEEMAENTKMLTEEIQTPLCKRSLDFASEEASFSWSQEVENSAKKVEIEEKVVTGDKSDSPVVKCDLDEYKPAVSPAAHSEHGSQDSGRATGGPASSMSPAQDSVQDPPFRSMYEFEIPNSLVGLIIGIKGKTIRELCLRTDVKMIIRPHHTPSKMNTHQICTVEGPRDNINKCLQMLRRRFPATRFPELNLKPVLPPPLASADLYGAVPSQLSLPEGVRCEVLVSAYVDSGHFFVQQPTHPAFPSLQRLDCYMLAIYSQSNGIPDLPRPCETGLLCVAPASGGWYRAVTIFYYEEEDEVLVRFVDYGGYSRVPRADLRQIRTDFMTLPFQAVECLLAHVEPVDGSSTWYPEANEMFVRLAMGRILEAFVVGYSVEDQTPIVELFTIDENNMAVRVDRALLDAGLAKAADPSKMRCVPPKPVVSPVPVHSVNAADPVSTVPTRSTSLNS